MDIAQIVRYDELNIVAFIGADGTPHYPQNPDQVRGAVDFAFEDGYLVVVYDDGRRIKFDENNQLVVSSNIIITLDGYVAEVIVPLEEYYPVMTQITHLGNDIIIPPTYDKSGVIMIRGNYYMTRGFIKLKKKPSKLANNLIPSAMINVFYNAFLKYYVTFDSCGRPLFIVADKLDCNVKHKLSIQCGYIFVDEYFCGYGMPSRTGLGPCELLVKNGLSNGSYIHYADGVLQYGQQKYYGKFSFQTYNIYKVGKYVFAMNMVNGNFVMLW